MAVGIFSAQNVATFTGRVQNAVHEVSIVKKINENQKIEGDAALQLIQAATQVAPQASGNSVSGSIINVTV